MKRQIRSALLFILLVLPFVFLSSLPVNAQLSGCNIPVVCDDDDEDDEDEQEEEKSNSSSSDSGNYLESLGSKVNDTVDDGLSSAQDFGNDTKETLKTYGNQSKNYLLDKKDQVSSGVSSIGEKAGPMKQKLVDNFSSNPSDSTGGSGGFSFRDRFQSTKEYLIPDSGSFDLDVREKVSSTGEKIKDRVQDTGSRVKDHVTSTGSKIKDTGSKVKDRLVQTGERIKKGGKSIVQGGRKKVSETMKAGADVVGSMPDVIPSCLNKEALGEDVVAVGENVGDQLVEEAKNPTNPIETVKDVAYNLERFGKYSFDAVKATVKSPGESKTDTLEWVDNVILGKAGDPDMYMEIKRDPSLAKWASDYDKLGEDRVEELLNKQSASVREQYRNVRDRISKHDAAVAELQHLLLGLTHGRNLKGSSARERSLLSELSRMADMSEDHVLDDLDFDRLVASTLMEARDPISIHQQDRSTCVATSSIITAAQADPAEYVRMVRGLAGEEGTVRLNNGDQLRRKELDTYNRGNQTQSQRLLSTSLMEYANPAWEYKDNNGNDQMDKQSVNAGGCEIGLYPGLLPWESKRIMEALHNQEFRVSPVNPSNLKSVEKLMSEYLSQGEPVMAGIIWGDIGHQISVTKVDENYVHFDNPHGESAKMEKDEFLHRLFNLILPK